MNKQNKRKNNLKLFPIYKMFSWDLLFYYAVNFLFLTKVKGISASEILFIDAFYPLFKIFFQIFGVSIIDGIGKRKSLIFGNLFVASSILILILLNGPLALTLSNLIMAIGYTLKELSEPTFLDDSIPASQYKPNIFAKIDGKGSYWYYILAAISSVITGFIFVANNYLPMILCFIFGLISTLIAFNFEEITVKKEKSNNTSSGIKNYINDLKISFKFIFKSTRLRCLLLCSALICSIFSVFGTIRSSLLVSLTVPEEYFGIIAAVTQIISAISSKKQQWFHETFKKRTLTWFSLTISISLIITGLFVIAKLPPVAISIVVSLLIFIVYFSKGAYFTLINRYYNSFSTPELNTKIYAAKLLIESLIRMLVCLFISFLLGVTTIEYAYVILGCVLTLAFIFLLDYMKTRIGLKPEEYKKKDIEFTIVR